MKKTQQYDKIFPYQKVNSHLLNKKINLEKKINELNNSIINQKNQFKVSNSEKFTIEEMGTISLVLSFYKFLIKLKKIKNILEVGTFIGNSTLELASALPKGGKLMSIEKFDEFYEIAKKNISQNKINNVQLVKGDALKILSDLNIKEKFDLVFLDGNKEKYKEYLVRLKNLVKKDGLVIVDDIFFHGDLFNKKSKTKKGKGVKNCMQYLLKNKNLWEITLMPLSNGIVILKKR